MDPQACLDALLSLVERPDGMEVDDTDKTFELLTAYDTWRRNGGFEPKNGDVTWRLIHEWMHRNFKAGV